MSAKINRFQKILTKAIFFAAAFCGLPSSVLAAPTPTFSVTSMGRTSNLTVVASINVADSDAGLPGYFYLAAKDANGTWFAHNGSSWGAWTPGTPIPSYTASAVPLASRSIEVTRNANMTGYVGTHVYVGYGASEENMRNGRNADVYTVPPDAPLPASNLQTLKVSATDPAIAYRSDQFHVYRECDTNPCLDDQKLFVFLPGSDGLATDHQKIATVIGRTGIRVLVLAYQNASSLNSVCTIDSCYTNARRDRVEGATPATPFVSSTADGIKNRLLKALQALGWSQFYSGNTLLPQKIIFGGFSQGAGMAAWIGKQYPVARVCQFSGTWDNVNGVSATWLSGPSATPLNQFYGFTHQNDSVGVNYLDQNWKALGMGSAPVNLFTTNLTGQKIYANDSDASCLGNTHGCSVLDSATPMNADGSPRYDLAWKYACGR